MKNNKLMIIAACGLLFAAVGVLFAGERGPERKTSTIIAAATTNNIVALPIGDTGRFNAQYLVFSGLAASKTQTVSVIANGVSNALCTVISSNILPIANVPWLFSGDYFVVTSTATNAIDVTVVGEVWD